MLSVAILTLAVPSARAQWVTQSFALKAGWNAVYLHVDASHDTLENLIAADLDNPIIEVWLWAPPASTLQFLQSPQLPVENAQWLSWVRNSQDTQPLQRLVGNVACLVRVATNVANYTWTLKGRPVPPSYEWTTTGLNLLGFPTVPTGAPSFENFFAHAPDLRLNAEIYRYNGGDLGPGNPTRVYALRTTFVNRGQAFWIRAGTVFNRYFAPFETVISGSGVRYGDNLNTVGFRLRNLTATNLGVTVRLLASETPPSGQTSIAGTPPLWVRGALNTTNLTYNYSSLPTDGTHVWTLGPQGQDGSDIEVVLALDRTAMGGEPGQLFAGVLRFTDALGFSQVDVPVSALAADTSGLWVGAAAVQQVGQYLKSYATDASGALATSNGAYVVSSLNTDMASVPREFPLRLIVHNPGAGGQARLLQRVFVGVDAATNPVVATTESALNPAFLSQARRMSAAHLPWTANNASWAFDGPLARVTNITTTVTLDYADQASNPFLHTYHPDHDNLDATFKNRLAQGAESYSVRRQITLEVQPPEGGVAGLAANGQSLSGIYHETVTLEGLARGGGNVDSRVFHVRGVFNLNRISDVSTLTTP